MRRLVLLCIAPSSVYDKCMRLPALLLFAFLLQAQPDPRDLLLHSNDAIKKYSSYQIHSLSEVQTSGATNTHLELPAVISVRRPDRMRIESQNGATSMTVVSDGSHTYVYLDQQKKYIKRAATSSPESILGENSVLKNIPDLSTFITGVKITGEKSMEVGDQTYECWIVEARYSTIKLPDQQLTISNAVQVSWISKTLGLTLQNGFTAHLVVGSLPEPVEMTQATTTVSLDLNPSLPDSLFVFTPPPGATQTADWTLPGIVKPDLEGKPAPELKGAPPIKGKVVLLDFWTTWCAPCRQQLPVLEKLHKEFRPQGLLVVGMNVGEDKEAISKFRLTYPSLQLPADDELLKSLSVTAFPTLILIDRQGKVALYEIGAKSEPALRAALAKQGIKPTPEAKK